MLGNDGGILKVATYNIHRCVGTDGVLSPDRIVDIIQQLDVHVVALQEVVSNTGHDGGMLGYLADKTGMKPIPGLTMLEGDGYYGNALLCRLPILDVKRWDISVEGREPRGILQVHCSHGQMEFVVFATHLGLGVRERMFQVKELIRRTNRESANCCIVAGDFNEWNRWGRNLRMMQKTFGKAASRSTFPAGYPLFSLDRIWVNSKGSIRSIAAVKNKLTRVGSDHLPLIATITT